MLYGFSQETVARIWRAMLFVERSFLQSGRTRSERARRLPRTYRRFTLTERLDAGGSAAVTWEDGSSGTVTDPNGNAYGLPDEQGEAAAALNGDSIEWQVTTSPGQDIYVGSLAADATSTGAVDVTIGSETVSCQMRADPGSGKKWASGSTVYVGHNAGSWEIVSILDCPVDQ